MNETFSTPSYIILEQRGILAVTGVDAPLFLQGLITNDVAETLEGRLIYAALLTPQGKFLHDFFVANWEGEFLLDCERSRIDDLKRRLSMYRLRSRVGFEDRTPVLSVGVAFGDGAFEALDLLAEDIGRLRSLDGGFVCIDPRTKMIGARAYLATADLEAMLQQLGLLKVDIQNYERLRILSGVPDGSRDMIVEKSILLENRIDELNGIDWNKGCYMGQELTARTRYRGLIKKKLVPVSLEGPLPPCGTPIMRGDNKAGEIRSGVGDVALALLRLDVLHDASFDGLPLTAAGVTIVPRLPSDAPNWL